MLRRACAVAVRILSCYFRVRHDGCNGEGVSSDRQRILHRATKDRIPRQVSCLTPECQLYYSLPKVQWWADESKQRRREYRVTNCWLSRSHWCCLFKPQSVEKWCHKCASSSAAIGCCCWALRGHAHRPITVAQQTVATPIVRPSNFTTDRHCCLSQSCCQYYQLFVPDYKQEVIYNTHSNCFHYI